MIDWEQSPAVRTGWPRPDRECVCGVQWHSSVGELCWSCGADSSQHPLRLKLGQ